jgi:prefoldin subunit 5
MADAPSRLAVEAEVRALRQEVAELRAEQKALARAIDEMTQTFRSLAVHLGIASEPYKKATGSSSRDRDLPGFA